MFRSDQVMSASAVRKNFSKLAMRLRKDPQAILITQKNGHKLVLVSAEIYEDLMDARYSSWASTAYDEPLQDSP